MDANLLPWVLSGVSGFLGSQLFDVCKSVFIKKPLEKELETIALSLNTGKIPHNHDIEKALRESVQLAIIALAFHRAFGQDKGFWASLKSPSEWDTLADRFLSKLTGSPKGHTLEIYWLEALVQAAKDEDQLARFNLAIPLDRGGLGRFLKGAQPRFFRRHLNQELLDWVKSVETLKNTGRKPADFDQLVTRGMSDADGRPVLDSFHDLFLLFFREKIKTAERVFRAVMVHLITGGEATLRDLQRIGRRHEALLNQVLSRVTDGSAPDWPSFWTQFSAKQHQQNVEVLGRLQNIEFSVHRTEAGVSQANQGIAQANQRIAGVAKKVEVLTSIVGEVRLNTPSKALEPDKSRGSWLHLRHLLKEATSDAERLVVYETELVAHPQWNNLRRQFAKFLYQKAGDDEAAERQFERCVTDAPSDPMTLGDFANFLWTRRNQLKRAKILYEKALEKGPGDRDLQDNYAKLKRAAPHLWPNAEKI